MRHSLFLCSLFAWEQQTLAFAPIPITSRIQPAPPVGITTSRRATNTEESEVERLLRKARELREQAEVAEQQVHLTLAEKKAEADKHTDHLIEELFFSSPRSQAGLVDRLRQKALCIDTLEQVVDRLDEREVIAEGQDHVEHQISGPQVEFHRVTNSRDEAELEKIQGLIDNLIDAVKVLDEEFLAEKEQKGEVYVTHTEEQHYGGGKSAERLFNRSHEIRREREEQFQKRMEEFKEAQRIKKDKPPPPKVKDDHGLLP